MIVFVLDYLWLLCTGQFWICDETMHGPARVRGRTARRKNLVHISFSLAHPFPSIHPPHLYLLPPSLPSHSLPLLPLFLMATKAAYKRVRPLFPYFLPQFTESPTSALKGVCCHAEGATPFRLGCSRRKRHPNLCAYLPPTLQILKLISSFLQGILLS
jgi:hypothetical protein